MMACRHYHFLNIFCQTLRFTLVGQCAVHNPFFFCFSPASRCTRGRPPGRRAPRPYGNAAVTAPTRPFRHRHRVFFGQFSPRHATHAHVTNRVLQHTGRTLRRNVATSHYSSAVLRRLLFTFFFYFFFRG